MINLLTILTGGMRMKTQNNQIIFAQLGSEGHHELVQGHDNSRKNLSSYLQSTCLCLTLAFIADVTCPLAYGR